MDTISRMPFTAAEDEKRRALCTMTAIKAITQSNICRQLQAISLWSCSACRRRGFLDHPQLNLLAGRGSTAGHTPPVKGWAVTCVRADLESASRIRDYKFISSVSFCGYVTLCLSWPSIAPPRGFISVLLLAGSKKKEEVIHGPMIKAGLPTAFKLKRTSLKSPQKEKEDTAAERRSCDSNPRPLTWAANLLDESADTLSQTPSFDTKREQRRVDRQAGP